MSGCWIRSTAPVLHRGLSDLGHADRAAAPGTPVFGMMHQPFIGERFSGDSGSAHYHGPSGERKLAVRRCASLKEATCSPPVRC